MRAFSVISAFVISASVWLQSCLSPEYKSVDDALRYAGKNRPELERVLDHYADDSLKLKAARFLIANMPGHYSYRDTTAVDSFYDSIDSLVCSMDYCSNPQIQKAILWLYENRGARNFPIVEDVHIISADFLIDNIDRAFDNWQNIPWCRNLDFEQFCEYILPYKSTDLQELRPWRNSYNWIYEDSLKQASSCSLFRISSFQSADIVNNCLRNNFSRDAIDYELPPLLYRPLSRLAIPFGTCDELCKAGMNIFRAAGIPVVHDYVPLWGYGNRGHSWAVVYAPNGHDIPFVPVYMSPKFQHKINETVSKAYRHTYARNEDIVRLNSAGSYVPSTFRNIFQKDVTELYASVRDIEIDVTDNTGSYVYLCGPSRAIWKPVDFTKVSGNKAKFRNVGKGCIYMLAEYDKRGNIIPLSKPFLIDRDGSIRELSPDFCRRVDAKLYRKSPLLEYAWNMAVKTSGGAFEASDDPEFRKFVTVGISDIPADQAGELVMPDSLGAYRYWRYIHRADSAECFIGEITFVSGSEIVNNRGRVIGNFDRNAQSVLEDGSRAFDGDVLTALSFSKRGEAWVGLDFGKPVTIDMIRYCPRSDGNMIEPGDEYELYFWNNDRWHSLGRKTAKTVLLTYPNIPTDALYVLHNVTKGSSVRVFLLDKSGQQEWW